MICIGDLVRLTKSYKRSLKYMDSRGIKRFKIMKVIDVGPPFRKFHRRVGRKNLHIFSQQITLDVKVPKTEINWVNGVVKREVVGTELLVLDIRNVVLHRKGEKARRGLRTSIVSQVRKDEAYTDHIRV